MPKDGFLTPKAIANRIKAKGLQRLRWYCQVCQKQCRDENGFKNHCNSESHQRQMHVVGEHAGSYIYSYSKEFETEFIKLLSSRYNTQRVFANQVYQEYISDRHHIHMNATRWHSLSEFVKYLGRSGIAHVDESEKGWFIAWIDNSPKALERQAAQQKRARQDMDDEQREQRQIQEQIEKAKRDAEAEEKADTGPKELKRENEEEKIKLNLFGPKENGNGATTNGIEKPKTAFAMSISGMKKPGGLAALAKKSAPAANPGNPLSSSTPTRPPEKRKMTAMEEIMHQEQMRKKRREAMGNDHRPRE
ncbi:hypothetical protein BZG36_04237 [Bifiguratus adelaidae]|uniref:C2H2-type domain-containing protein n=1 Tax=Bifiguratus adelaidae TaxID=1938954 RepID=A0A261Y0X2_9FUNG|nr:hypothetical protein BZG36_04237 [Bifiguratus adelaidae]